MRAGARLRVLVVEDDPIMARTIGRVLASRGHSVVTALCCTAARNAEGRFDVGIFDLDLPDGHGATLAESLLAAGVVYLATFFSGTCSPDAIRSAAKIGTFVSKADGVMALIEALENGISGSLRAMAVGADPEAVTETRSVSGPRRIVPR